MKSKLKNKLKKKSAHLSLQLRRTSQPQFWVTEGNQRSKARNQFFTRHIPEFKKNDRCEHFNFFRDSSRNLAVMIFALFKHTFQHFSTIFFIFLSSFFLSLTFISIFGNNQQHKENTSMNVEKYLGNSSSIYDNFQEFNQKGVSLLP